MALDDTAGGLPADEPQIKATMPRTGGLTLAGQKGVSLNASDSTDIRDRLMQMIQQREEAASGWGPIMERAAVSAGAPGTFAQNLQSFNTNQRAKENDIFNMRVNLAQLNTEEARIKQAQMQEAENSWNFQNALRQEQGLPPLPRPSALSGGAPAPQGAPMAAPAPQGAPMAAPAPQAGGMAPQAQRPMSNISPTQMAVLNQMYANPATRAEAQKQFLALTKKDEVARRLEAAGIMPGTPEYNAAMFTNVVGATAFNPQDTRTAGGTVQQTPFGAASALLAGKQPPTAPVGAPAPQAAPQPVAAPAAPVAAPAAPVAAPAAPMQRSPFTPGSKEDLDWKQKQAGIPIAGATREAEKNAEVDSEQQKQHSMDVAEAKTNAMVAQSMQKDIRKADSLLGKLAGGGAQSAFFGLIDQGIQVGQLGTINAPGFAEAVVKMDPKAKDSAVMDAYVRVAKDVEGLKLAYTRKVFQGQGAVTENERKLIDTAVGNVNRMSPANLMRMAKATELEARNKMDQDRLWSQMKSAGMSWSQYKGSKELADMQRNQFYRTAKTFGVKDAVWPGDQQR
jgi:hypothetical protein